MRRERHRGTELQRGEMEGEKNAAKGRIERERKRISNTRDSDVCVCMGGA